jgi:hypothetical protein
MAVNTSTIVMAVVTLLASSGVLFEIGRRMGQASSQHDTIDSDVSQLEKMVESKFNKLDTRLNQTEQARKVENRIIISWMSDLTDVMRQEGYNVERPDAISEDIDVNITASENDE